MSVTGAVEYSGGGRCRDDNLVADFRRIGFTGIGKRLVLDGLPKREEDRASRRLVGDSKGCLRVADGGHILLGGIGDRQERCLIGGVYQSRAGLSGRQGQVFRRRSPLLDGRDDIGRERFLRGCDCDMDRGGEQSKRDESHDSEVFLIRRGALSVRLFP